MSESIDIDTKTRRPSRLRKRDVRRLVDAAEAAGLAVTAVEWLADGGLRVLTGAKAQPTLASANSWDSIL
jgi:hypothetical protein